MNYARLVKTINSATAQLQGRVAAVANHSLVLRNWLIGSWIIEFEQNGKDRAKYGAKLLETLAADLKASELRGLGDPRVLRDCRVFYQIYPQIRGSVTRKLPPSLEPAQLLRLSWSNIRSKRDQALFGKSTQANLKDLIHAL